MTTMSRSFVLALVVASAFAIEQCSDDSFAIAYEGETYFSVDKTNGVCSCDTFSGQFRDINGQLLSNASTIIALQNNYSSLQAAFQQLQQQIAVLQNGASLGGRGGACFVNADCLGAPNLACSPSKLRCLGTVDANCTTDNECIDGTFCSAQRCQAVQCDALQLPQGVTASVSNGGYYPSTATYACASGYVASGSAMASCRPDGTWTGVPPTCADVNECATNNGGCHQYATCNNTAGTFQCACLPGLLGDGYNCISSKLTCYDLLLAAQAANTNLSSGVYLIGNPPLPTYCDMTTDGGGWTQFWAAPNGYLYQIGRFEGPSPYVCNDTANSCMRRLTPMANTNYTIMAMCNGHAIKFRPTQQVLNYFQIGSTLTFQWQPGTVPITPAVMPFSMMYFYGGSGSDGWMLSPTASSTQTFLASYTPNSAYDQCNGVPGSGWQGRLFYRQPIFTNYPPSCREIKIATPDAQSGNYWIDPDGDMGPIFPYQVYCEMEIDGGGYTTFFANKNGQNYFFQSPYNNFVDCPDPTNQCVRRLPANVDTTYQIIATCGGAAVKFQNTAPFLQYWQSSSANTATTGFVQIPSMAPASPSTFAIGQLWFWGQPTGWSLAGASNGLPAFTSSVSNQGFAWDMCNGQYTNGVMTRLMYKAYTHTNAPPSCYELSLTNSTLPSGVYMIDPDGPGPNVAYPAYCDMTTDGGGWTAFHTFLNGYSFAAGFDRFDNGIGINCPDPTGRCIRRLPSWTNQTFHYMAQCGDKAIKFIGNINVLNYFKFGTATGVNGIVGAIPVAGRVYNYNFMNFNAPSGSGWYLSADTSTGNGYCFVSSWPAGTAWDFCNGTAVTGIPSKLLFRPAITAVYPASCLDIKLANQSAESGIYMIDPDGPLGARFPYPVYCDHSIDNGGWTAFYSGRNGVSYHFGRFDSTAWSCPDPASQCLRWLPPQADLSYSILATCGNASVKFMMNSQALSYFRDGANQGNTYIQLPQVITVGNPNSTFIMGQMNLWAGSSPWGWLLMKYPNYGNPVGIFGGSSASGGYDYCNGVANSGAPLRLYYRPTLNTSFPTSCLDVIQQNSSAVTGLYWIDPDGPNGPSFPYQALCDMSLDAGGWTAFFVGRNGYPYSKYAIGDPFGSQVFENSPWDCTDPAVNCMRRLPAAVNTSYDFVAMCGSAALKFTVTASILSYFKSGSYWLGYQTFPTSQALTTGLQPFNTFGIHMGTSGTNPGFWISPQNGANVFMNNYNYPNTAWDQCNGVAFQGNQTRLYYRPALTQTYPASCKEVLALNPSAPSAMYWIDPDGPGPYGAYQAWCEMTLDGGGWTTFYTFRNGYSNALTFQQFENVQYSCPEPNQNAFTPKCMRRLPPTVDTNYHLMVQCGNGAVKMVFNAQLLNFFKFGSQTSGWVSIPGAMPVVGTTIAVPKFYAFLGNGQTYGWAFANNNAGTGLNGILASAYYGGTGYDFCNGIGGTGTSMRLLYRQADNATLFPASCEAVKAINATAVSGMYTIDPDGPGANFPYDTWCDMTTDGGGWTQFFANNIGSGSYGALTDFNAIPWNCPNPQNQCLRRLPPPVDQTYHIMATCGNSPIVSIKFPLWSSQGQCAFQYFKNGNAYATTSCYLNHVVNATASGLYPFGSMFLWAASPNAGWVLSSHYSVSASYVFASSVSAAGYDYCNGLGSTSVVRLYYRSNKYNNEPTSCQEIKERNPSAPTGVYFIDPDGPGPVYAYQAHCDMTSDGGGWTTFYAYTNGNPAFNAYLGGTFDNSYFGPWNCYDPAGKCIRRLPAQVNSTYQFLISCGPHQIKTYFNNPPIDYFKNGGYGYNWFTVSSGGTFTPVTSSVYRMPVLYMYIGTGQNYGFAFSATNGAPNFMSSYYTTGLDYCNGNIDQSSGIKIAYRMPPNVTYPASCQDILLANPVATSNIYWIDPDGALGQVLPYQVWCDMQIDGGGYTYFFSANNGYLNAWPNGPYDRLDATAATCPDPQGQCARRVPPAVDTTYSFIVTCGPNAIKFQAPVNYINYIKFGSTSGFTQLLSSTSLTPWSTMPNGQMWFYGGNGAASGGSGWAISALSSAGSSTFSSSVTTAGAAWDYCNGTYISGQNVRMMYRPPQATPVLPTSCQDVQRMFPDALSGIRTIDPDGSGPTVAYDVYCDMSTDGGGWTGFFAREAGSAFYFTNFYNDFWNCRLPASWCLRRLPANADLSFQILATTGSESIKFSMTPPILNHFKFGSAAGWMNIANVVPVTWSVMPFNYFSILAGNPDWVIANNQGSGTNTFTSSHSSTSYNWVNGQAFSGNMTRLYYRMSNGTANVTFTSCAEILASNPSSVSGQYMIDVDGPSGPQLPLPTYCDMTTDGGGWTSFWVGTNGGSSAVTNQFDLYSYYCPSVTGRCMRRIPTFVDTNYHVLATCGPYSIKMQMHPNMAAYFQSGGGMGTWSPTTSPIPVTPNVFPFGTMQFLGTASTGWILSINQTTTGTFMSSYAGSSAWDYCNGIPSMYQVSRLSYRAPRPVPEAPQDCQAILTNNTAAQSGLYMIDPDGPGPGYAIQTFCDMSSDGGGYTAFFVGRSLTAARFANFDTHQWHCVNASYQCHRRVPSLVTTNYTFMATCGTGKIKFLVPPAVITFWQTGSITANWNALPQVIPLNATTMPFGTMWWQSLSTGWTLQRDQAASGSVNQLFAASWGNGNYEFCNGVAGSNQQMMLLYRPNVYNASYPTSCLNYTSVTNISGNYWIDPDGPGPQFPMPTYCDMNTEGGGWTAFWSGTNGQAYRFNSFEGTPWDCSDPANRCIRRLPDTIDNTYLFLAQCGTAFVKFTMWYNSISFMITGDPRTRWVSTNGWDGPGGAAMGLPSYERASANCMPLERLSFYSGDYSTSLSWLLGNAQTAARAFAASHNNAGWDYCNGVSTVNQVQRLFYRPVQYGPQYYAHCLAILKANPNAASGVYTVDPDGNGVLFPYQTYCDMTTDGGGWTAFWVGKQGKLFANNLHETVTTNCPDPMSMCARRLPLWADQSYTIMAQCGTAAMKFTPNPQFLGYFRDGTQYGAWYQLPGVINLTPGMPTYNNLWILPGSSAPYGWTLSQGQTGTGTFLSSYYPNTGFDYCNMVPSTAALGRLLFRPPVNGTGVTVNPATLLPSSCKEILQANASATSGVYTLGHYTGVSYQTYCDMTTHGGGWTLILKAHGNSSTFQYNSALWLNQLTYNPQFPDFDDNEAKLMSYMLVPYSSVMIGMKGFMNTTNTAPGNFFYNSTVHKWGLLHWTSSSFYAQISPNSHVPSFNGQNFWRQMVPQPSIPAGNACNQEGLNACPYSASPPYQCVRIGYLGSPAACGTPSTQAFIGIGGSPSGTPFKVGQVVDNSGTPFSPYYWGAVGYVFVR